MLKDMADIFVLRLFLRANGSFLIRIWSQSYPSCRKTTSLALRNWALKDSLLHLLYAKEDRETMSKNYSRIIFMAP